MVNRVLIKELGLGWTWVPNWLRITQLWGIGLPNCGELGFQVSSYNTVLSLLKKCSEISLPTVKTFLDECRFLQSNFDLA